MTNGGLAMTYGQQYFSPYQMQTPNMMPYAPPAAAMQQSTQILPPQQILTANGKASIDLLRMAPNSSVYIEDSTVPNLVWKCVSDSLGQVTPTPFDLSPHEQAPIIDNNGLFALVGQMNDRITKLEDMANAGENAQPAANSDHAGAGTKAVDAPKSATPRNTVANGGKSESGALAGIIIQ